MKLFKFQRTIFFFFSLEDDANLVLVVSGQRVCGCALLLDSCDSHKISVPFQALQPEAFAARPALQRCAPLPPGRQLLLHRGRQLPFHQSQSTLHRRQLALHRDGRGRASSANAFRPDRPYARSLPIPFPGLWLRVNVCGPGKGAPDDAHKQRHAGESKDRNRKDPGLSRRCH